MSVGKILTKDEIIANAVIRCDELSLQHGKKITLVVLGSENETVICFLKEINRTAKLRILDSVMTGGFSACEMLVDDCLLHEADYLKIKDNDDYYIGVVMEINNMVKASVNQFKKK